MFPLERILICLHKNDFKNESLKVKRNQNDYFNFI